MAESQVLTLTYPKTERQDKTRQDKPRQDKTRQDKTRQDKTRQDKTRQDKTRQDKTTTLSLTLILPSNKGDCASYLCDLG
jgi:hypothetical protein